VEDSESGMSNKSRPFRIIKNVIGVFIILAFLYFGVLPFVFGGKDMKTFCQQITPGMPSNEVYKLTEQTHYKLLESKEGDKHTITIYDAKAMGRFICEVPLDHNKVIEAKYIHND
jgi:hypothetical protein